MIIGVILAGLVGAVAGFLGVGFGAARVLVGALGNHDGGSDMAGFFFFGPIGGLAGALLGVGMAMRMGGGSTGWSKGLMIGAGALTAVIGLLLVIAAAPKSGPSYSHVIEFQLEVPAGVLAGVEIPSPKAMWGGAGADMDDKPISQFFDKSCEGDVCVLQGAIAALGPMNNFRIRADVGGKAFRFVLGVPEVVSGPVDWSDWAVEEGGRLRWRIVRR